ERCGSDEPGVVAGTASGDVRERRGVGRIRTARGIVHVSRQIGNALLERWRRRGRRGQPGRSDTRLSAKRRANRDGSDEKENSNHRGIISQIIRSEAKGYYPTTLTIDSPFRIWST